MTDIIQGSGGGYRDEWSPAEYLAAFEHGQTVEIPDDSGLRGRILRGRTDEEFEVLGTPERDLVFIMGPDGLSELPGTPVLDALDKIGLRPEYVQGRIAQGYGFRLVVFNGADQAPLATWDNALNMIAGLHPEIGDDIELHREALVSTPFDEFEERVGASLDLIDLAGEEDPRYMTLGRYMCLPEEAREDPTNLRRLLLHMEHLGPLFSGDGHTRTSDGEVGLLEYLIPNGPVAELPDVKVINLDV